MSNTYEFDSGEYGCDLDFTDGVVTFGAYSYHIDSYGNGELSKEETRKLYEAMKEYYGDK